ncbi:HTH-type transcriptional regulator PuuR [Pseudogemmobacter humi]|uniref:HTH-type transcriptional regulator PuuR n=2 Tax=Pseudogemmobacter humi TaxID=2483812 RepID=A0A3P5X357_9RHOB|nr:HTH-type transcriptional regulator PuuR [Pseudogemmobacter humi]
MLQDVPANAATEKTLAIIGQRIRELRKGRGMTLQALAEATGLSSSMLSLVERGLASPSIGSLVVISEALGKSMSALIVEGEGPQDNLVVRAAEARVLETGTGAVRRVMKEDTLNGVTVAINEYPAHTGSSEQPLSHYGYEYGFLLEGSLIVEVDGANHVLKAGDLVSYSSQRPHRIWNPGPGTARTLWFNTSRK